MHMNYLKSMEVNDMRSLEGTETAINLMRAFAGESGKKQILFCMALQKEGYRQIKDIFLVTAENERAHAKVFINLLQKALKIDCL